MVASILLMRDTQPNRLMYSPLKALQPLLKACALVLSGLLWIAPTSANAQQPPAASGETGTENIQPAGSGAMRLRQLPPTNTPAPEERERAPTANTAVTYVPGEFERFVQRLQNGQDVRRLGSDLVTGTFDGRGSELSPLVPGDYIVSAGDEVLITLWGSLDADLRLTVDRAGRIAVPRVGAIQVAGVRYAELQNVVSRRVAQVFKNFEISVTLGQLRGIRVFVTGFVVKPGTYTVSGLSTVLPALMRAGGPSSAGSFRNVELRRGGQLVSTLDLYDLLQRGDRSTDRIVQAGDVVHVAAVGTQVGVIGSVNRPAVVELKTGETVADALRFAGGFTAVADASRLAVERLRDRNLARVAELQLPGDLQEPLGNGDVIRALSAVENVLPSQRQSKRIRIDGEVSRPAEYILKEGSTMQDALAAAGGMTGNAYVYATEFTRESVRVTQQQNYERALRDLETEIAKASAGRRLSTAEESTASAQSNADTARLLERLRALRPSGRIVLQLAPDSTDLPAMALEDGDRIYIPQRPTTVGVLGSVFNAAAYVYTPGRALGDYLRLAGGATKGADDASVFVIRANGSVISNRQDTRWFRNVGPVENTPALPGDTVFVPEEVNKSTVLQTSLDWTRLIYQLGLGLAGFSTVFK